MAVGAIGNVPAERMRRNDLAIGWDGMTSDKGERQRAVRVDAEGEKEVLFGIEICDGPETYRLLITHPIAKEGLIEEIPKDSIESIVTAKPGPRRQQPEIVDEE